MLRKCFLTIVLSLLMSQPGWGYKEADLREALAKKSCYACDLEGVDLSKANLKNAYLPGVHLERANLSMANLTGANLSSGKLMWADLSRANLSNANLYYAYLMFANLTGANLTGADLEWADLTKATFCKTIMPSGVENNSGCGTAPKKQLSTALANDSGKVWCAHSGGVALAFPGTCKAWEGKGYSDKSRAEAEYKRLKSSSVASSSSTETGSKAEKTTIVEKEVPKPTQTTDTSLELEFWQSIKDSDDPGMYRAYLEAFPEGTFVLLAKLNLKKLTGTTETIDSAIPDLNYGEYYALVIGNNDYDYLSDLKTAVNDAESVASLLKEDYAFEVSLLKNATRAETVKALSGFRKTVGTNDSLLIYYAGHGHLDEAADEGYWLPVDSSPDDPSNWLQNDTIVAQIRAMDAKHVMIVADSCFSGTLTRAIKIELRTPFDLQKIVEKKARTALTSGGLEPVLDSRGGTHSVFAKSFISLLEENPGVLDAHQLFSSLRAQVALNSSQIPEYGNIHEAGHDGGDFFFVKTAKINRQEEEKKRLDAKQEAKEEKRKREEEAKRIAEEKKQREAEAKRKAEEKKQREAEAKRTNDVSIRHQGGTYSGEVLDGIPNGQGTWNSPDGQQYVGQWQDGLWHGEGTYSAADGSVSVGEYQNGRRNGQSTWSHPDGRKYVGEFREDQIHGQGVHTFSNGDRYAGAFENDKQHGEGTYTFSDGSVVAGDWQNGKPWQAKYADVSEQEIGQYIDGIWYAKTETPEQITPEVTAEKQSKVVVTASTPTTVTLGEQDAYDQAFNMLKQSRYEEAAEEFANFLRQYQNSQLTDDAWYWMAEAHYVTRDFERALIGFNTVVSYFVNSARIPASRLKIGYIQYETADYEGSRETLTQLLKDFPGHRVANSAKARLNKLDRERN